MRDFARPSLLRICYKTAPFQKRMRKKTLYSEGFRKVADMLQSQISKVKIAVDSGMCIMPTELSSRMQTLP